MYACVHCIQFYSEYTCTCTVHYLLGICCVVYLYSAKQALVEVVLYLQLLCELDVLYESVNINH